MPELDTLFTFTNASLSLLSTDAPDDIELALLGRDRSIASMENTRQPQSFWADAYSRWPVPTWLEGRDRLPGILPEKA